MPESTRATGSILPAKPLAILISLPLSLIGVVLALIITGDTLNIMSLIGVIRFRSWIVAKFWRRIIRTHFRPETAAEPAASVE